MDKTLEEVCKALEKLADSFSSQKNEKRNLSEIHGWHHPSISFLELSDIPRNLAQQIKESSQVIEISEDTKNILQKIPNKLQILQNITVQQILSGNALQAIPAYMTTLEWVSIQIRPLLSWQLVPNMNAVPSQLLHKLDIYKRSIEEISINKEELEKSIQLIQNAKETAESLPADLITLQDARKSIEKNVSESNNNSQKILEFKDQSILDKEIINERLEEAKKLIEQCEEAYKITTTKGLAGAFEVRAKELSKSAWIWVGGLLAALVVGAVIGLERLNLLMATFSSTNPRFSIIIMQSFLSALSLGAPLWFAWLATKQIGQHFKLSEDYAFKASVAKAYEGYRKEAARIDPEFEKRLFDSALTRVDEPPLRLVENHNHGSPWHELFNAKLTNLPSFEELKSFINGLPSDLQNKLSEYLSSKKTSKPTQNEPKE